MLDKCDRMTDSRISGFYKMDVAQRIDALASSGAIDSADAVRLQSGRACLPVKIADKMIENVIGTFGLPFGIAPNFLINGRDFLVPMVVEEPSIVAGLSGAAKLVRETGGFTTRADESLLAGQIQIAEIQDPDRLIDLLMSRQNDLCDLANKSMAGLVRRGGGARRIEIYKRQLEDGEWTVMLHLLVDTCDAMGANVVNTACERIAPEVEALSGGRVVLRILSNLATRSLVCAELLLPTSALALDGFAGDRVRDDIVLATQTANADPYRATTHNKGIMNGVDAVAIATGNDWRAIEAAAHAYAVRDGAYRSLSDWRVDREGNLCGKLIMPLKVGIVGGSLNANPGVNLGLRIAGVGSARELAGMMAAVGLAQNFAALRALVTHGIQRGHMRLHARSVASTAGVSSERFDDVVDAMIRSGEIKAWKAEELDRAAGSGPAESAAPIETTQTGVGASSAKVILLGEHAAVYDKHVLALPLRDAVRASISRCDGPVRLQLNEMGRRQTVTLNKGAGGGGLTGALQLIQKRMGVDQQGFEIAIRSRVPAAMGLGSSAAFAVAIIRAYDDLLDAGMDDRAVDSLAFDCEKLAHGTPSGIDNNLATFGQPVLFTKGSATRTRPIQLAESPPIVVAASGLRGVTKEQVAGVRLRFDANRQLYSTIFSEIDEISIAGAVALRERDYKTLGSLMNVCHGFLNAIEVSTPELERMVSTAREAGAVGAKLTGAGGGGSIVALCPGTETQVAEALASEGYAIIRTVEELS